LLIPTEAKLANFSFLDLVDINVAILIPYEKEKKVCFSQFPIAIPLKVVQQKTTHIQTLRPSQRKPSKLRNGVFSG
jgi:hypothetical protein